MHCLTLSDWRPFHRNALLILYIIHKKHTAKMLSILTSRLKRFQEIPAREIPGKIAEKLRYLFSPSNNLRRVAFALESFSVKKHNLPYEERVEFGPSNLGIKLRRKAAGGPFEPLDVALVNRAAIQLMGSPKSILEVGSGTGLFASLSADALANSQITASEFEDATRDWAIKNRSRKNISYCKSALSEFKIDDFELVVTLEVIEHIDDYPSFLKELARVAPNAIISTPNKLRNWRDSVANSPSFEEHVREFSTEAFYWVLRCYWNDVKVYAIPQLQKQMARLRDDMNYQPEIIETGLHCREHCMLAICSSPRR